MLPWSDLLVRQQHAADLLSAAEKERFARQVLVDHGRYRLVNRVRGWLGQRMVAWGTKLQKRYRADLGPFTLSSGQPRRSSAR